jgi:hypothetical protein
VSRAVAEKLDFVKQGTTTVKAERFGIYKDNGNGWLKIKNRAYSQAKGRHELLTRRR